MNARKFLVSSVAALSVVGSIGLAYAQTTTEPAGSGSAAPTPAGRVDNSTNASTTNPTMAPNTTMTPSTTMPASTDGSTTALPVQADRN